eukprot:CAMPEP_0194268794 /NCGR_PEP_ID=MMETSP0169-20130528/3063_1 /TAXON_ID=218684 /ORGANISM="Corethron pennatum, Strain L29A3" /LENGTH=202 /DNA_ID=CAMNT_0039010179 /DNA_START=94 /DNA_END=702 /DNA_ORIENTATION=+
MIKGKGKRLLSAFLYARVLSLGNDALAGAQKICTDTMPAYGTPDTVTVSRYNNPSGGTSGGPCSACVDEPKESYTMPRKSDECVSLTKATTGKKDFSFKNFSFNKGNFEYTQYGGSCDCSANGTVKTVGKECTVDENTNMCSVITIFKKCKDAVRTNTKCQNVLKLDKEKKARRCVKAKKHCPYACGECDGGGGGSGGGLRQ